MKRLITYAISSLTLCSCISIGLGPSKPTPSKDISFQKPSSAFQEVDVANVDHAWRNNKNGNSISYFSDCTDKTDPSLQSLQTGILQGVQDIKFEKQDSIEYNGRAALASVVVGRVDGVETKLSFIVFKKNSCIFILNYVGVKNYFHENEKDFIQFTKGFKVQ